jgi:catechol 2,3-dioxygenase-like lactoylglutathione lyase family enzyme
MYDPLPIEFIHHVSRVTRDLDKSIDFYQHVLGFQPLARPGLMKWISG